MAQAQLSEPTFEKKSSPRRDRLEARVAAEQKALFQKAADLQGKTLTEFLIHSAQQEALKTVRDYEVITLGEEDRRIFIDAFLNPKLPNDALRSAAKEYLKDHQ